VQDGFEATVKPSDIKIESGREADLHGSSTAAVLQHESSPANNAGVEDRFDAVFTTQLALREKQIQQNYRPVIGIHKWFARRPGTVFRSLMLAEYGDRPLREAYWRPQRFSGVIGDPFMGGGTPLYEANRLGFHVVGCDINPMAHWIVTQALTDLDCTALERTADEVITDVEAEIGRFYCTTCSQCGADAKVKYFLWVKSAECPRCRTTNDVFPGHLLAEAVRHPHNVLVCPHCGLLNEYQDVPKKANPATCRGCSNPAYVEGRIVKKKIACRSCEATFPYVLPDNGPPKHRLWAIEYNCGFCYANIRGRQFKAPDKADLARFGEATRLLDKCRADLPIPEDDIPSGDETDRLHRWGYRKYKELFNERQLLGLGLLMRRILQVPNLPIRNALLTIFSDTLRYQNMLCRYDTYALKCQDIFSVHGFPVGLVQCENAVLGIPRVGSGAFRHFVEKYVKAKDYCHQPFETAQRGRQKSIVPIRGETIQADIVDTLPASRVSKQALLMCGPSQDAPLAPSSLDGVFTDPPYFDNVQYAELIDFCYVWLRQAKISPTFQRVSTRSSSELTGNVTEGRGQEHFTAGLQQVFQHFARALRPGAPFVFTYHHNDAEAYLPLVVAILGAGLTCTATLPAAAEMSASMHIAGTGSSILDSVFVCRVWGPEAAEAVEDHHAECRRLLVQDGEHMKAAGVRVSQGDLRCLLAGHLARFTIRVLRTGWMDAPIGEQLEVARGTLRKIAADVQPAALVDEVLPMLTTPTQGELFS